MLWVVHDTKDAPRHVLKSVIPQAHQHAANADDFLAQGLLIPAAEENYKAAMAFEAAYQASNDEHVWPSHALDLEMDGTHHFV